MCSYAFNRLSDGRYEVIADGKTVTIAEDVKAAVKTIERMQEAEEERYEQIH